MAYAGAAYIANSELSGKRRKGTVNKRLDMCMLCVPMAISLSKTCSWLARKAAEAIDQNDLCLTITVWVKQYVSCPIIASRI